MIDTLTQWLGTALDLLLVMTGFGLIIFLHELGHFLAARWAGIRVLAFAVGFGPALFSYRKDVGLRRGSASDRPTTPTTPTTPTAPTAPAADHPGRSAPRPRPHPPTEYRLNALPLGGYVKMLGQEDLNPEAVSAAPDSYQSAPPWKRMVVISAGVVMNLISAALLFVLVFSLGLKVPPAAVGSTQPGSPAAQAVALNGPEDQPIGLQHGDRILSINGVRPRSFNDIFPATALAEPGRPLELLIARPGLTEPLRFEIIPKPSELSGGLLELGIAPPTTLTLGGADLTGPDSAAFAKALARSGLDGVEPGSTLVDLDGRAEIRGWGDIRDAFAASAGRPVPMGFVSPSGQPIDLLVPPLAQFETARATTSKDSTTPVEHLLGLESVMRVNPDADPKAVKQGLQPGDVFLRIGSVEFPSIAQGIREIKSRSGKTIELVVARPIPPADPPADPSADPDPSAPIRPPAVRVALTANVTRNGTIGFPPDSLERDDTLLAASTPWLVPLSGQGPVAVITNDRPGARILEIAGRPVRTMVEAREALRAAILASITDPSAPPGDLQILATLQPPTPQTQTQTVTQTVNVTWTLDETARARLLGLGWEPPFAPGIFKPEIFTLKAGSPVEAVAIGLHETRRLLVMTYVQFIRMFQGSVRIEHVKGPVGIAHLGTLIASRGPVWLLFFFAMISVNLAVVNFLPLPIVDGGQFLMLVYEQLRGRPVPMGFQNAVTTAGLLMLAAVFLIVTFNDLRSLLGG